ncbi:MAG: carboxylesterase family protein [Lachnospiraceae bacterium]|nr:carboxylesterase family protein [Lachnospiraceae bacterium]
MAKQFICDETTIAATKSGKVQGFLEDSTYIFQGIKYADAGRFQSPVPVKPWEGVKPAMSYGYVCPLLSQEKPNGEVLVPHRYWLMDENCQYLNIWTQSLDTSAQKPVMVWLHGGGFFAGSSIEQVAYDGRNMSRFGDVVVVSLNHRLNILGYLDMSYYGEKYQNSANAGNEDIVAALQWIQENIAQFGGNPDNVTLFGQSGGGMKVWTLMQTPSADGLFHKGIIQSGVADDFLSAKSGREITEALFKELGLSVKEADKLEKVPYHDLALTYNKVAPALSAAGKYVGNNPVPNDFYPGDPREIGFTDHAKTIPVMIGTVFSEFASFGKAVVEDKYSVSDETALNYLQEAYGENTAELKQAFQKAYPGKNLLDLLQVDRYFRDPSLDFTMKKALCPQAETYSYQFTLEFPLEGGKCAWHCSDIPFVFHNTELVPVCTVPGVTDRLEERMFGAWISFARYGNPSCASLPAWSACKPGVEATMIFDRECEVRYNFDHELRECLKKTKAVMSTVPSKDADAKEDVIFLH